MKQINIQQYWSDYKDTPLFDVRTPAEFQKGHIPKAINLPLFSDEERVVVGTIYKQQSPQAALLKGLDFVGPKMRHLIETVQATTDTPKIAVHCWRGGKRSGSVGWLLNMAGYTTQTLKGGYKAYRTYVLEQLEAVKLPLIVLGGKTGCNKTKILKALAAQGEQIIDLEGLAHHKGSAFGFIGETEQPSTEQFQNNLYEHIRSLDCTRRIWIENESKGIGKVFMPDCFWKKMKVAPLINIELPLEERITTLVAAYKIEDIAALQIGFSKIKKRLGGLCYQQAMDCLAQRDLKGATRIALAYYDKSYQYMLETNTTPIIHHLRFHGKSPAEMATELRTFCDRLTVSYGFRLATDLG